jgi:hypothetical protein
LRKFDFALDISIDEVKMILTIGWDVIMAIETPTRASGRASRRASNILLVF